MFPDWRRRPSYYGGGIPAAAVEQPLCPVMLHFGKKDGYIAMEGVVRLNALHAARTVHVYDAGHGLTCEQRGAWAVCNLGANSHPGILPQECRLKRPAPAGAVCHSGTGKPALVLAAASNARWILIDHRDARTNYCNRSNARSTKLAALEGLVIEASAWE